MAVVAIDGPAGAGKSTIARLLAQKLGPDWQFLDTGALFRGLTLACFEAGVDLDDEAAVAALAKRLTIEFRDGRLFINGRDRTEDIRRPDVTENVRRIADMCGVREVIAGWERRMASGKNVVVEGRDMTSVVFADAEFKFYLDAAAEERARRRLKDLTKQGVDATFEEVLQAVLRRDEADTTRKRAPLTRVPDAVYIDSTNLTPQQVVEKMLAVIRSRR